MALRTLLDTSDLPAQPLGTDAPRLSKSRLVHGLQCDRRLWLAVHRPELAVIDAATQGIFDSGNRVGEVAREVAVREWGQGELIDVKEPLGWQGGWRRCREALEQARSRGNRVVLFEAPFIAPDFAVIADIVVCQPDGEIWLIEVKSSTKLDGKPYLDDATFQADAMARCGFRPEKVFVRLIDTSFVYPGGGDYRGLGIRRADSASVNAVDAAPATFRAQPQWKTGAATTSTGDRRVSTADNGMKSLGTDGLRTAARVFRERRRSRGRG